MWRNCSPIRRRPIVSADRSGRREVVALNYHAQAIAGSAENIGQVDSTAVSSIENAVHRP